MPSFLKNGDVELHWDRPDESYRAPRFDWSGKIFKVIFKGTTITGCEKDFPLKSPHKGRGFYNEFGIDQPVGFAECIKGDWFHKIGIGLLQKSTDEYLFNYPYKTRPLPFVVDQTPTSLIFACHSPLANGYAYSYEKEIFLTHQGFTINYTLKNTGEKCIETNEYNHNFIRIGESQIGRNYVLKFPFKLKPGSSGEVVNPNRVVEFNEDEISLAGIPESPVFFSFLNGEEEVKARWEMVNTAVGMGIREEGSFTTSKVNLWGWKGALCPEIFVDIKINGGETQTWKRTYTFYQTR